MDCGLYWLLQNVYRFPAICNVGKHSIAAGFTLHAYRSVTSSGQLINIILIFQIIFGTSIVVRMACSLDIFWFFMNFSCDAYVLKIERARLFHWTIVQERQKYKLFWMSTVLTKINFYRTYLYATVLYALILPMTGHLILYMLAYDD